MLRKLCFLSMIHTMLPAGAMAQCIYQPSELESSVFEDPQYGNQNIDGLDDAFFPTNDRESLSVDIQYDFHGFPNRSITFRWAWSPINLFIYPFDFQFLSLFTVRYTTGFSTVQIADPVCSNVSQKEIVSLLDGFTQAVRGYIVNGYTHQGRKIDNHQTGYTSLLDYEDNPNIFFALLLTGAFLSTVVPCLVLLYRHLFKLKLFPGRLKGYSSVPKEVEAAGIVSSHQDTVSAAVEPKINCEAKEAWDYGTVTVLRLLAVILIALELVHFGYGVTPAQDRGQPETFFVAFGAFSAILLVDIGSSCLCIGLSKRTDSKVARLLKMTLTTLGIQLVLFHAPFVLLGISSLPFQATITIAMYGCVIVIFVIGVSLSRYEYLIKSQKRSCSECMIIATTLLAATVVVLLAVVDLLITHYFHSTADISETALTQFFMSLLSLSVSAGLSFFLWKKYLQMCEKLKEWLKEDSESNNDSSCAQAQEPPQDDVVDPASSLVRA